MNDEALSCIVCRERVAIRRGCCSSCYAKHSRDVSSKKTSWEQLEIEGKVRKKKPSGTNWRKK